MASNHLEDLVAEWFEFNGYFIRRNVQVGPRPKGGYECELDVIAFNPSQAKLVQVETSLDAESWAKRELRYQRKFAAGRKYIPTLFEGLALPSDIEQRALFVYGSTVKHQTIGGGTVWLIKDFMREVRDALRIRLVASAAVPEQFPLLRSLQFAAHYWP